MHTTILVGDGLRRDGFLNLDSLADLGRRFLAAFSWSASH
jgi:hypothetical protein